jgi:S-formylglutathione hydrolase FrmB
MVSSSSFAKVSLISDSTTILVVILALIAVLLSFVWRTRLWRAQLLLGVPIAAVLVAIASLVIHAFDLIPFHYPGSYYVWVGLVAFALAIGVIGWRRFPNWQRVVSVLSIILTTLMALTLINDHYQYYPTVGALFGVDAQDQVSIQQLQAIRARAAREHGGAIPTSGFTIMIDIPGTKSGFHARTAQVWVPPAWVADAKARLPLIMLLAGTPGSPEDWTRAAFADQTAQSFARLHGGKAPLIVMPDENGSHDTECVNSPLGNAETYLTVDVLHFMRTHFGADLLKHGRPTVAVAGLSEGATCAAMLALRHPDLFSTFGDYAGLSGPTVGNKVQPQLTIEQLFGGSSKSYDQHNPVWLLKHRRFPRTNGWFEVGTADHQPLAAQRLLVPLAIKSGMHVCSVEIPDAGHDFSFWGLAFHDSLPWLSWRLGLTPKPSFEPAHCGK